MDVQPVPPGSGITLSVPYGSISYTVTAPAPGDSVPVEITFNNTPMFTVDQLYSYGMLVVYKDRGTGPIDPAQDEIQECDPLNNIVDDCWNYLGANTLEIVLVDNGPNGFDLDTQPQVIRDPIVIGSFINLPPVADAGTDQNIFLGETVILNGSGSSDYDGDPLTYTWAIDSAPAESTSTLSDTNISNPTLTPDLVGEYIVSLIMNDGTYNSAADTVSISVIQNLPPVAAIAGVPNSGLAPLTVSFNASGSTDPEGDPLSFDWDFGDGNTGTGVNPSHTYDIPTAYTAVVRVTDDLGNTDMASMEISVTAPNLPPTVGPTATPVNGTAPLEIQFAANAADPEYDPLTYTWDLGDGNSSNEPSPIHTYYNPGTYVAQVTVSDGEFYVSDTVTVSVSSALKIHVREAKVNFGEKGKVKGKVNLKADFVYTGIPGPSDLIVVVFDGITLVEEPFGNFEEEDDESAEYEYKEKNLHVKIDFNKSRIKVSRHKMLLTGIDNSNGIDVVISFGDATGTDHFVMEEKGDKKDHDDDEKKLSYKDKKKDD